MTAFERRWQQFGEEVGRLFDELYPGDGAAFAYFRDMLEWNWQARKEALREVDEARLREPDWYRTNRMYGMMMYPENYGGTLQGVRERLGYLEECGINYLHLMPLLDTPEGKSDGGYAVSDFRKVRPDLGTMEDLEALADDCRDKGMVLCLDFVLNHTSEEHAWATAARAGDPLAMGRYFLYDDWSIPNRFEQHVPQVFPTTAPGNYTWLADCGKIVMTTFYPFQWDLNYANPMVFNDMTDNLLYLANRGMDVIRLDAIPYIWKQLGTNCRNLPQVHTLTRMMKLACQVVCPGVLLLGEVVMEPREVAPYFGSQERPECDMLYNVTTMCTTWHTLATRDVRLLRHQIDQLQWLPSHTLFQNYLRCHDDIGWGLDYPWLAWFGMQEVPHKRYLNDWFTGRWDGSWSRGELYNDAEALGDARLCGTTASLSGLESALYEENEPAIRRGIDCDLMLHAWMFTQSGIPVLYSGDEIGQLNDYSYHYDPAKWSDSRYLHRGRFQWELEARRKTPGTVQQQLYDGIRTLARIRSAHEVFHSDAEVRTFDTGSDRVLGVERVYGAEVLAGLFNFSETPQELPISLPGYEDLLSGRVTEGGACTLPAYGFLWLCKRKESL
ncbi:MAG: amylosucrase [Mogibacterium sp.]|nr:amylosucrase [Mogibacterium sp.]